MEEIFIDFSTNPKSYVMSKLIVFTGKIYIIGDSRLSDLLKNYSKDLKDLFFIPEMNAILDVPFEVESWEELDNLIHQGFDPNLIFTVVDTSLQYGYVCNKLNIGHIHQYCKGRFVELYKKYTRQDIKINHVGVLRVLRLYKEAVWNQTAFYIDFKIIFCMLIPEKKLTNT